MPGLLRAAYRTKLAEKALAPDAAQAAAVEHLSKVESTQHVVSAPV